MRSAGRKALIHHVRQRYALQLLAEFGTTQDAGTVLDENILTLGFARRFATYKRPNLLLRDPERLIRLLTDPQHPVQLILAGKAHPQDQAGQALIKQWNDFTKRSEVRSRVVFLSDDDMLLTQELVQGVDLWINTPRRPWEACGTSGMKILVNGGLNLSELDGWWAEAYTPEVGWAIGDGQEHGDDAGWDSIEVEELYGLLEREVIPQFYDRDERGLPSRWLGRIRESMARLTSEFSASRAIREYTENHYLPAAAGYLSRAASKSAQGISLSHWREHLAEHWNTLSFSSVEVDTHDGIHFFRIQIYLGYLSAAEVKVQLYANPVGEHSSGVETMSAYGAPDAQSLQTFLGEVPSARPAADYTPRLVPFHTNASVPLEAHQILWQR
jgi:starch phosphorylase